MRRYISFSPFVKIGAERRLVPESVSAQKRAQLRRCFELRNWIERLESRGKGILQAPHGPGSELIELGVEIILVDVSGQMPGSFKRSLDKGSIDDKLGRIVRDL